MKGWQRFTCGEMHNIAGITEIHLPTKHRRTAQELETLANSCSSSKIEYVPVNALAGWPQICMTDDQAPFARIWIFEIHIILTQRGRGWVSRFTTFVLFQKYPESCGWGFSLNDFNLVLELVSLVESFSMCVDMITYDYWNWVPLTYFPFFSLLKPLLASAVGLHFKEAPSQTWELKARWRAKGTISA